MRTAMAVVALGLLWAGCAAPLRLLQTLTGTPTSTPTLTPQPTPSPTSTPFATLPPTASPRPSPTFDPSITLSPTPTLVLPSPFPSTTAISVLDCGLKWQSPGSGIEFHPGEVFTVGWKVSNTGTTIWVPGSTEFIYAGGAKLHRDPVVQLASSVSPGESVVLTAELRAPENSTKYTTYWSLHQDETMFCRVSLSIYVK